MQPQQGELFARTAFEPEHQATTKRLHKIMTTLNDLAAEPTRSAALRRGDVERVLAYARVVVARIEAEGNDVE